MMMSPIEIKYPGKNLRDFLEVPILVNRDIPSFIPTLRLDVKNTLDFSKNPYWKTAEGHVVVVYKNGKPVGRGVAIYNRLHQEIYADSCGYFSLVDCINDQEVFDALLEELGSFLKNKNCTQMIGPLNPSINYELGVLSKGFELAPFIRMTYNQKYYHSLYRNGGFVPEMKFFAYRVPNVIHEGKIDRVLDYIKRKNNIEIEDIDFKNFKTEALTLCQTYNDAFSSHYRFIPFSEEEFLHVAKDLQLILDRQLIFKVKVNGELAGFILALPNMNEVIKRLKGGRLSFVGIIKFLIYKRKVDYVKVMVAAIKKKYQYLGLGSILYKEMAKRVKDGGYKGGELSWVAADNIKMNKMIREMGGELTKEYIVYSREI